jgi:arylsulfatase
VLELLGITPPPDIRGIAQSPIEGTSFAHTLSQPEAPSRHDTQYYEQFACRALYHRGWKAVTFHPFLPYEATDNPSAHPDEHRWELYDVVDDPSECHDLAATHPEKLRELQALWAREAERYGALPLQSVRFFGHGRPPIVPPSDRVVLRPGAAPLPEELAPSVKLRPHHLIARVEIPPGGAEGVLIAQGGRFGGFALYVQDGRAHYTYNFAGVEETTVSSAPLAPGRHVIAAELTPGRRTAMHATLVVDDAVVGAVDVPRSSPFRFALHGEGMCCGYDDGTPVVDRAAEVRRAWMVQ